MKKYLILLCLATALSTASPAFSMYNNSFIWLGNLAKQFSYEQFTDIVTKYPYFIFAKFHANWDINQVHQAAAVIKRRNPSVVIFPYLSASTWFDSYQFAQGQMQEAWYLHDLQGNRIPHVAGGKGNYYVDVTNVEYRNFVLGIIASWMSLTTPKGVPLYDGMFFDGCNLYDFDMDEFLIMDPDYKRIYDVIGKLGMIARNDATRLLLRETKALLRGKLLAFNGIAQYNWKEERSLGLLKEADIAVDENFCFRGSKVMVEGAIMRNVNLMCKHGYGRKMFFEKANLFTTASMTPDIIAQLRRMAYGAFMLGHQPGHTFFKYGEDGLGVGEMLYSTWGEIENRKKVYIDPPEINLDFGLPLGGYAMDGGLRKRDFEKGWIYVNLKTTPQSAVLPENLVLMNGGVAGQTFKTGDVLTLGPNDAAFLFR